MAKRAQTIRPIVEPRQYEQRRANANSRGYGRRWQDAAELYLDDNPLCVYCEKEGHIVAATVVDHKIPHRRDPFLFWDPKNWQPLCKPHHDAKTRRGE